MAENRFLIHALMSHEVAVKEEDWGCRKTNVREKYMGLQHRKSHVMKNIACRYSMYFVFSK